MKATPSFEWSSPSDDYSAAVSSLGGLRLTYTPISRSRSTKALTPLQSSSTRQSSAQLTKTRSTPSLPSRRLLANAPSPSTSCGSSTQYIALPHHLTRVPAPTSPEKIKKLPPLKLSLKEVLSVDGLPSGESEVSKEHGDDEEEDDDEEDLSDEDGERVAALGAFNTRHASRSLEARSQLRDANREKKKTIRRPRAATSFDDRLGEVFRNRLYLREKYDPFAAPPRPPRADAAPAAASKRRRRAKWKLDGSMWHPRKLYGNSHDYFETYESLRTVFDVDWAIASIQIGKLVERADMKGSSWIDEDGNGKHDAVDAAGQALWKHGRLIYGAFDYYAALFDTGKDIDGEVEIFQMSYNAFIEFSRDCGLLCSTLTQRDLDIIWTTVNALPRDLLVQKIDRFNHKRLMCRHEFLQALVRIAVAVFGLTSGASDVANLIEKLCQKLGEVLPPEALQDSNAFRKKRCYQELTETTLRRALPSLRSIFDVYSRANRNTASDLQDSQAMSIGEWLAMIEHVGLFQMGQVSFFGAKAIFKWSIIRACPDHSAQSERKLRHLNFMDFCEALVRLACVIALPTDAELEEAQAADAGEYLFALMDCGDVEQFVSERKTGWRSQPKQHVSRCVHHLISLLVRTVKQDVSTLGNAAGAVSQGEAQLFEERRRQGRTLHHVQSEASTLDGVRASQSIVRAKLLAALHRVEIFAVLTEEQIEALCSAMSQAVFNEGQWVFEQGDDGDAFFVITEGRAVVLRSEPNDQYEKELATLGEGAFFGERALLKNQVRYAGIQAETAQLYTVSVTREGCERALGAPLEQLIPDQYKLDAVELRERIAAMPLFESLTPTQIHLVAERCTEVKFQEGTDVIRQGDVGDALYIITRGTADVLRYPDAGVDSSEESGEKLLAQLDAWKAFGERALVRNETRYATVRATSMELHVMSINRDVVEKALGLKLSEVFKELDYEKK